MSCVGPLGGEAVALEQVRGKVRATVSCRESPPLRSRERSAMPFLAKFRRKVENNVKFVAFFRKRLSNSWHFYILILSNSWQYEVKTC